MTRAERQMLAARVLELRAQKASFDRIAEMLHITRGQVAGIYHRARIAAGAIPMRRRVKREEIATAAAAIVVRDSVVPSAPVTASRPADGSSARGCRWIEGGDYLERQRRGENIFCCAPTTGPGEPWCAEHRERCYVAGTSVEARKAARQAERSAA